ncbi:hypothetical protein LYNGBM3L_57380 [Moorena producens 3L]|uniref:Uncharacterized protein n=1 Tax=Moorena producens 3L TaxID=489825 RepID=F4XZP3_9CYAN|nr:hypothetical protein [Moorena producens]EGJ30048.1 hypothetical protein LYNGBM3L_57380 [Moorena producens 3L]
MNQGKAVTRISRGKDSHLHGYQVVVVLLDQAVNPPYIHGMVSHQRIALLN